MSLRRILLAVTVAVSLVATREIALARGSGGSGGGSGGGGHGGHSHGGHGGHHHGGHGHGTVVVGAGFWYYPPYYPYYPYYLPADMATAPIPIQYLEQGTPEQGAADEQDDGYWYYYCAEAQAYYPNVTACPAGWQKVAPAPSN